VTDVATKPEGYPVPDAVAVREGVVGGVKVEDAVHDEVDEPVLVLAGVPELVAVGVPELVAVLLAVAVCEGALVARSTARPGAPPRPRPAR